MRIPAAAWIVVCCLALAACTGRDSAQPAYDVELRQSLTEAELHAEVIDCVLQLGSDELRRGPLTPAMKDELVVSCERAQQVLDESEYASGGSEAGGPSSGGGLAFSDDPADDQRLGYGHDAVLDRLWDRCDAGDGEACDRLFEQSPVGSEYEEFGLTCGNRDLVLDCEELGAEASTESEPQPAGS